MGSLKSIPRICIQWFKFSRYINYRIMKVSVKDPTKGTSYVSNNSKLLRN